MELISQYLDVIISLLVTNIPTFIKDAPDAIRLCKDIICTDDHQNRCLITMDICSRYTNIRTAEGLTTLK